MWKVDIVRPIAKVGTPSGLSDFRSISIVSILSKAFERILHDQVLVHVNNHSLLSDFQSGFRRGNSSTTVLARVTEDLRFSMAEEKITVLSLLDFSKAFDMVNDLLFRHKLGSEYDFHTSATRNLVSSFLQDRSMVVEVHVLCFLVCRRVVYSLNQLILQQRACSKPNANILFSQISVTEMNTDHDLFYGAYKVSEINITSYKEQMKKENYIVRKAKRRYMGHFLDPRQPVRRLWQHLESVGVKESMFTPDQLDDFFLAASPRPFTSPITSLTTASPGTTTTAAESSIYEELSFNGTFDLEVFNAIHQIKSAAWTMYQ
jgi:hypothetical protein